MRLEKEEEENHDPQSARTLTRYDPIYIRQSPSTTVLLGILRHELVLLRDRHALRLLSLRGVHLWRHALLRHVRRVRLSLGLRLGVMLWWWLLRVLRRMWEVERRRRHRTRRWHWVGELAGSEVRVLERLGGGNALCRVELQKAFEEVDGLGRCFREDLREGDLGVAWILLRLLLIVGFLERNQSSCTEENIDIHLLPPV